MKDMHGNNALHKAAMYETITAIEIVAKYKFDVNGKNFKEQTALHIASKLNNIEPVKYLIENYLLVTFFFTKSLNLRNKLSFLQSYFF